MTMNVMCDGPRIACHRILPTQVPSSLPGSETECGPQQRGQKSPSSSNISIFSSSDHSFAWATAACSLVSLSILANAEAITLMCVVLRVLLCESFANACVPTKGCAAHIIKGSIFLIWGLLSFARYLGAWSEIGWAWNAKPKSDDWRQGAPSAEFVESFLIFFYGSTNTFVSFSAASERRVHFN